MSSSSQDIEPTSLELGSGLKISAKSAFVSFGFAFALFSSALSKLTPGTFMHNVLLCIMGILLINMVAMIFVTKTITAIRGVRLKILYSIAPMKLNLYKKETQINNVAWVRSRIDENKEVLIEVGTRGFETTDIIRIGGNEVEVISKAEKITSDLAKLWNIENKGHNKFA